MMLHTMAFSAARDMGALSRRDSHVRQSGE